MGYYDKLFKLNSSNNTFEKPTVKEPLREIQVMYIYSNYISNLCADTSFDNFLITLVTSALDILKYINK